MRTESDLVAALKSLEPHAPDGAALLRSVRRRSARRRIARAGGLAGLTSMAAVVTAVALTAGTTGGPAISDGHQRAARKAATEPARTAAYVVRHAAAARAAASRMIQVSRNGSGLYYTSVATRQQVYISRTRTSNGQPLMAYKESIKGATYTSMLVDYKDRAYEVQSASTRDGGPGGARGIVIGSWLPWLPSVKASNPAAAYTAALKQKRIKVIGYRNLAGRKTVLIHILPPPPARCWRHFTEAGGHPAARVVPCNSPGAVPLPRSKCPTSPTIDAVWLDASTYLTAREVRMEPTYQTAREVRMEWDGHPPGQCAKVTGYRKYTTSYWWLQPTKRNLTRLDLTPPPGFTQVSSKKMADYLGPYS